jgi:hypothetical protein
VEHLAAWPFKGTLPTPARRREPMRKVRV